jgi:ribosomal protein S18 acetylase RimI-like enzyme
MLHIRFLIRADVEDVLAIDREEYEEEAYTEDNFLSFIRATNYIGFVAEIDGEVVGYCIYEISSPNKLHIHCLVVAKDYRRQGIGRQLILMLKKKQRGRKLVYDLSQWSTVGHHFLKAMGFKARVYKAEIYRFIYKKEKVLC